MNEGLLIIIGLVLVIGLAIVLGVRFARQSSQRTSAPDETLIGLPVRANTATYLLSIEGPFKGKRFNLNAAQISIGRSLDNAIMVDDDLVSRQHALIEKRHKELILYDRGSTNGTYVNGKQIYQHSLQVGDQIQIGPAMLVLTQPGQTSATLSKPVAVVKEATPPPRAYDLGQYDLTHTLGEGGAAIVYQGYAKRDHRPVAIKVLNSNDSYFRDKFKMELEVGQTLHHPYITAIYGGGQSQGAWYIVMELNEGGSLRTRLPANQVLSVSEAVRVIGQTCDALAYAHQRGITHRDLKPENLMFSRDNATKLSDFGIARIASRKTITSRGVLVGTAEYMSVEQARGHDIDGRSDLYSLGIVFYEMLTGRRPFEGIEPLAILEQHIRAKPVPPSQINRALPEWLDSVVLHALEKDPNYRFQTSEEFARAVGYNEPFHGDQSRRDILQTLPPSASRPPAGARLITIKTGAIIPLTPTSEVILGREWTNPDPADDLISRRHARIAYQGGYWLIEDLNSANGTFVNEVRIWPAQPAVLQSNSFITIGNAQIQFEL